MYNDDSTIITMSATRDNIGKIQANSGAEKLFGYERQELMSSNIKMIMPKVFADHHDGFLQSFLDTSRSSILYKERMVFGRHKKGHIFKISLLVKPIFDVKTKFLQFIGFIHPLSKDFDHLITDHTGRICGLSDKVSKSLGLPYNYFESKTVYLPSLAPKTLYLYLDDRDEATLLRKTKSNNGKKEAFKRGNTDQDRLNKSPDGEFILHIYVSNSILENSARLFNPNSLPTHHDSLKTNFDGSNVYKVVCSTSDFITGNGRN